MERAASYRTLYLAGAWVEVVTAVGMVLAIGAFFVWPPVAGEREAAEVLQMLVADPWGGLMHLDPAVLVLNLVQLPFLLALYVALRDVDRSWSLLALGIGLVAVTLAVPTRPLLELYQLAWAHDAAATEEARLAVAAAAHGLLAQFNGTCWAAVTGGLPTSLLISSILMLRSPHFRPATAWAGIVTSAGSLVFFVPVVGVASLFLLGTVGGVVACALFARDLFRLARESIVD